MAVTLGLGVSCGRQLHWWEPLEATANRPGKLLGVCHGLDLLPSHSLVFLLPTRSWLDMDDAKVGFVEFTCSRRVDHV